MAILNIVKEGDEALRKVCRPVTEITPRVKQILDDMLDTLEDSGGVGLAAPQVGILRRIAIVDDGENYIELINPVITEREGEQEEMEGCLSVPDVWGITHRPMRVKGKALNRDGEEFTFEGEGLTARCFCHELDHLDGKLFIDEARILTPEEVEERMG